MKNENTPFNQLCVWPGAIVGPGKEKEFEELILKEFGTRVKYETEVKTNPDLDENGNAIPSTGGRNDLLFFVHDEDIMKFAVPRLQVGIRWWEDVVEYNKQSYLYSKEILDKYPIRW